MPPPYDQLYIYEIIGDARPVLSRPGPDYLGTWLEGASSFVFFRRPVDDLLADLLAGRPELRLRERHDLSYEQWQGGQEMGPLRLPGLTVVPAWGEPPAEVAGPVLRLDPGLVFGSGLHPTTRACLELLAARAAEGPLGRVLDLGCGTGILGLAAAALGAESVVMVDLNPLCVETSRQNAGHNRLAVEIIEGDAAPHLARPADLVLANLHWEIMERLLAREADLASKPELILSGITRSYAGVLVDRLAAIGYDVVSRREAEATWFTTWARRRP